MKIPNLAPRTVATGKPTRTRTWMAISTAPWPALGTGRTDEDYNHYDCQEEMGF